LDVSEQEVSVENIEKLKALTEPRSIAVVGASPRVGSISRIIFSNILMGGFSGIVFPVNPKRSSVMGVKAYPSVAAIGQPVDLAVIVVKRDFVPLVMEDCAKAGVRSVVVITAGFREIGPKGAEVEEKVKKIAADNGISLVGPNCLGVINTDPLIRLNATFAGEAPQVGNIAMISQSGALGVAALEYAKTAGIGLSKFFSVGNKAGVTENDLLRLLQQDKSTDVILMYLEDIDNHKEFVELAREITGDKLNPKPIIAIKAGRTRAGARAVQSHTGSLAGSERAYESIFSQAGIIRVQTMEELFNTAVAFAHQPMPKGKRIAIVTNGGGAGVMATDSAISEGLEVPRLDKATTQRLESFLPAEAGLSNPIDVLGDATEDRYYIAIRSALEDPNVDGLLVIVIPQLSAPMERVAKIIAEVAPDYGKPVLVSMMSLGDITDVLKILDEKGIPNYRLPEAATRAMARLGKFAEWLNRPRTPVTKFDDVNFDRARSIIDQAKKEDRSFLFEYESHDVMSSYGIPVLPGKVATSGAQALEIAKEIDAPVALKIVSPQILHKVDVGGVLLNCQPKDAEKCFDELIARVKKNKPDAEIKGVFVQKMAAKGHEMILGMKRDPRFGPLVMIGTGGIYVEVFHDVSFRLAPIRPLSAHTMLEQTMGYKLLKGFRGEPRSDIEAIEEGILRLSQLSLDLEDISELDINPLFVYEEGNGIVAADARILL